MRILFLFVNLPNLESANSIYSSLIKEFYRNGHHVLVSTLGQNINATKLEKENGIDVIRIKSNNFIRESNPFKKALAYQEYVIKQLYFTKRFFRDEKIDLIFSHSLPPELAYVIRGLKRKFKCPFYLHQSDFTWQDGVAFGYFGKYSLVALYYRFWERRMLKIADYIGCPTVGTALFILKEYPNLDKRKFRLLPYCKSDNDILFPDMSIRKKFGLKGKFICVYGGTVGKAQRIERMVELADSVKEYKDIQFVLLGRGTYLSNIKLLVEEKGLKNFLFVDFLPQDEYISFLLTCDVGLVILNEKTATPNFPSKTLSYLCLGIPILAALDYVTDFGEFLEEHEVGLWAYSDDVPMLKTQLLEYYNSKELCEKMRCKGRALYEKSFTPNKVYRTIIDSL